MGYSERHSGELRHLRPVVPQVMASVLAPAILYFVAIASDCLRIPWQGHAVTSDNRSPRRIRVVHFTPPSPTVWLGANLAL
jgi:hypothetical protein